MDIVGTRTLGSVLDDKARRFPDRVFVIGEDGARWTWREFARDVHRAAHFLVTRGLGPGDTFNLHLGNCPEFLIFWMAAAKTGTVMVPTNPVSTPDELAYILEHSGARMAITERAYAETCHAARSCCPRLADVVECRPLARLAADLPDTPLDVAVGARDEISMQYTSGTTSKPKGVLLTHANYIYGGEGMAKAMRAGRPTVTSSCCHSSTRAPSCMPSCRCCLRAGASRSWSGSAPAAS
jgi:carnitine-CoA ligase